MRPAGLKWLAWRIHAEHFIKLGVAIVIGLLFLFGFGLWLVVAIYLSKKIPRWLGVTKHGTAISVLFFPVVLAAPLADELIGRWQFYRLCEREAAVTLSPDWEKVKRARRVSLPRSDVGGAFIHIYSQGGKYVDADTGDIFMKHPPTSVRMAAFYLTVLGLA